jgi:hypothetical protein
VPLSAVWRSGARSKYRELFFVRVPGILTAFFPRILAGLGRL